MKKIIILWGILMLTFFWGMTEVKKEWITGEESRQTSVSSQKTAQTEKIQIPKDTGMRTEAKAQPKKETQMTEETERKIRVLLKNDGYASEYHTEITLTSNGDYAIGKEGDYSWYKAGEQITVTPQSDLFAKGDRLQVISEEGVFYFPDLVRAETGIAYEGSLEIRKKDQGLLLVNELPLETYLCGVLPSEMSASFPLEALKAQAVCARTYAMQQQEAQRAKEYDADLDDSTSYQVYNNRRHGAQTDQAVQETAGLVMMQEGHLVDARYYATSCGLDLHMDLSEDSVFAAFLQEDQVRSVEAEEPLYRWKTSIRLKDLQAKTEWNKIEDLQVAERNSKGAVIGLKVTGWKQNVEPETTEQQRNKLEEKKEAETIEGEYQVRQFLALVHPVITLQDGSTREGWQLLPSAFFYLQPVTEEDILTGYTVYGGGYGHGEGMSQNGAKHMARQGESWKTILNSYYGAIEIVRYSS